MLHHVGVPHFFTKEWHRKRRRGAKALEPGNLRFLGFLVVKTVRFVMAGSHENGGKTKF